MYNNPLQTQWSGIEKYIGFRSFLGGNYVDRMVSKRKDPPLTNSPRNVILESSFKFPKKYPKTCV